MKQFNRVRQASGTNNLEQFTPSVSGQTVTTKGYYEPDDGGGATYIILTDAEYGGTPDGFGDIQLSNGFVAKLMPDDVINVKQFGAKGDGVTNDKPAIQAAVDNIGDLGGKVYIPDSDSEYLIENSINIYTNMEVSGQSKRGARLRRTGTDTSGIQVSNGSDGLYTYDKVSAFNLIIDPDELARHIKVKSMTITGESQADSTAFDVPRAAYTSFEDLESRLFESLYIQEYNSFVVNFDNIRSSDCNVHWSITGGGSYHSFYNCYGNGSPTSGIGVQAQNVSNMQFYDCAMDSLGTGFLISGKSGVTIVGAGIEARLNHVRALDNATVFIYGGTWPLTVIGAQGADSARVLRAEGDSRIVMKGARSWLYDFSGGTITRENKAFAIATNDSSILVEDIKTEDDSGAYILPWDFIGEDSRAEINGNLTQTLNNIVLKRDNKSSLNIQTTEQFPLDQVLSILATIENDTTETTLATSDVLSYGDGISGSVTLNAFSDSDSGLAVHGTANYTFAISSRNSDIVELIEVDNTIIGFDNAGVNSTLSASIVGSQIVFTITQSSEYGTVRYQGVFKYKSYNASSGAKRINLA